eukprot:6173200-Pleurochrysis_carterae.AAC.3
MQEDRGERSFESVKQGPNLPWTFSARPCDGGKWPYPRRAFAWTCSYELDILRFALPSFSTTVAFALRPRICRCVSPCARMQRLCVCMQFLCVCMQVAGAVDMQTRRKAYNVSLEQLGPYRASFTANGRKLLLGGRKGHIAVANWDGFNILSEIQANMHTHSAYPVSCAFEIWVHLGRFPGGSTDRRVNSTAVSSVRQPLW